MLPAASSLDKRSAPALAARRLRVCMFVTNCVSIDTRVIKEAASLVAAGHSVTVIGLREPGQPETEEMEGFTVWRVRADTLHARRTSALSRALAPAAMAWALFDYSVRAHASATRHVFDVFHAHDLVTLPVAWASRGSRGGALVYDAHELFTEMGRLDAISRRLFRIVERLLIRRADRVVTVNDSIADELSRRYGIPSPLVVRNCPRTGGRRPDRRSSPLRSRAHVPEGTPIVLYQGLYMPHRGLENLVRAVAFFDRGHLVFLGWGPLLDDLRRLAVMEGVADRVTFLDPVPMSELLNVTAGADLGVIPYRNVGLNNYYTSPNKLFEYCVAGVPVVASRFPELVRIVEGKGFGRTFDPDSPQSMADAVNALLGNAAELERVRANVSRGGADLTWEREDNKLVDLYSALGQRPGAAARE